jgi:hypothetical protein
MILIAVHVFCILYIVYCVFSCICIPTYKYPFVYTHAHIYTSTMIGEVLLDMEDAHGSRVRGIGLCAWYFNGDASQSDDDREEEKREGECILLVGSVSTDGQFNVWHLDTNINGVRGSGKQTKASRANKNQTHKFTTTTMGEYIAL